MRASLHRFIVPEGASRMPHFDRPSQKKIVSLLLLLLLLLLMLKRT
jgi:hypothetical protein